MKTRILTFAATICTLFLTQQAFSQVTSVNYQLKYDTVLCRYDAYIIINAGSATTSSQRIQFNSQYSLVVPTGTAINVVESHMPLQGNLAYDGTIPCTWSITSSIISPAAQPESDFYSITPSLSPTSRYNDLQSGDTIKIFSFTVSAITNCGSEIRIYNNGVDPSSADAGMEGSDFSNGFTIGGILPRYNANSTTLSPPKPVIVSATTTCGSGIEIDLTASTSACQTPLSYSWTGPDGYSSTDEDVSIVPATSANTGDYKVIVTDSLGCRDSITITATNKPDAGIDQTVCAGTTALIAGTNPTTGVWTAQTGNPVGATLSLLAGGEANVTFSNNANGNYYFIYSGTACSDTMRFTVNPRPTVSISGSNSICIGSTTTLSPNTGGTWISNNIAVATVDANTGVVTAVAQGTATFTFTNTTTGCTNTTGPVTVNPRPTVTVTGTAAVCIGSTTTLSPTTGGTWTSVFDTVATVTNAGLVTGLSAGTARFVFTETSTGCISDTLNVTVTPSPNAYVDGPDSICVLTTTTLLPSSGGTWQSSNPAIATVNNSGLVTGLTPGSASFRWTETATGCTSPWTDSVWVIARPTVSLSAPVTCVGSTVTLTPTSGGIWSSNNISVATVVGNIATAVGQGSVTFTFINDVTGCANTTSPLTVNPRPTVLASSTTICIGGTATLTPSSGGTWVSLNGGIATVSGNVVTGVAEGVATVRFTETATGCTNTIDITVIPRPTVSIPVTQICIGNTTQLTPSTGGTWLSSNPAIASVSNSGLVTALAVGPVTFTFTSTVTGCSSMPTPTLNVLNRPVVSITGPTSICLGVTTQLSPTSGGTWSSTNPSVATVDDTGLVTAVAPGSATFIFTSTATGCPSLPTAPVSVNISSPVAFTGPSTVCEEFTTTVSPTTGGTWISSNPAIATITNAGLVTGISAGTANLTFTETATGCQSTNLVVTVSPKPQVTLDGPSPICIDSTTNLSANPSGGTWVSNAPLIASVNNAGLVTGVAQGTAIFTYTSTAGCASDPIVSIAIMPRPTVNITGPDEICIGTTTTLSPTTGGTWVSSADTVATVSAGGVVTGVAPGVATFTFISDDGCVSLPTGAITVNPRPTLVLNGPNSICVGATTNISPTTGGTWVSVNPTIASITNAGVITGLAPGESRFIFTQTGTGCISDTSSVVTVTPGPTVSITGDDELCIGETTTLSPNSGGTWESSNPAVATVTNAGLVTAVSQGVATFRFRQTTTGCLSDATAPVTVHGRPTVSVTGGTEICIGNTTTLSPSVGGTWSSSNTNVATVADNGIVTAVAPGTANFTFTLTATGCPSNPTEDIEVREAPIIGFTGNTEICIGTTTTLTPTTGGVWYSNDLTVATVTNSGVVTAVGPGKTTFYFIENGSGCASSGDTDTLTVSHCFNPDFNATFVNVPVPGDVSTNDFVVGGTTYGPTPVLKSSPSGSIYTLTINSDGTYNFVANMEGVYIFEVPVCVPPLVSGCPRSELTIHVRDFLNPAKQPVANVDFATTRLNTAVTLNTLANDRCVVVTGCNLDQTSVTIISPPANGVATPSNVNGDITYTPNNGVRGIDSLVYRVCVDGEPANCATAKQYITINDTTALNTTYAADDFAVTPQSVAVSGNVADNDGDAEGDSQSVTAQTTTVSAGTLVLDTDGSYTFTPEDNFFGPVEFIYETCDDNPDGSVCAYATLHILVVPDLTIKVRVYLEGALMNNANAVASDARPLMRDQLRVNSFTGKRYIPNRDPFKYPVSLKVETSPNDSVSLITLDVVSKFTKVGAGTYSRWDSIPNPADVFLVTGQNAIVDWVFIELRNKSNNTQVLATRSGLLQRDGDVVDLDGVSGLRFPDLPMDDYYVVVRHHRHLGIMSATPQTPQKLTDLVNFTTTAVPTFDFGTQFGSQRIYTGLAQNNGVKLGYFAMWAGDFDGNGKIKADNPNDDLNTLFFDVFSYPSNTSGNVNYDFAFGYLAGDYDMNGKAKFDNPNDDKNMLYGQLLFYPLNTALLSNYDFFIQQLP